MKALFLAGGTGTRLRPLTDRLPKPMVPLMNRPMLERNLLTLKRYGIREIVLSTCYKADRIREYFGDGGSLGLRLAYVREDIPLGTGGAIRNAARYFDGTFLVFNADILCRLDFADLVRFHRAKRADVTIAVTSVPDPSAYGVIEYDAQGYATSFTEKPKPEDIRSHFINAGVYVFEPRVLKNIAAGRPVSVEREVFPSLLARGRRIAVYDGCSYWMDVGTPEKYLRAHRDIFEGKYPLPGFQDAAADGSARAFLAKSARINATAQIVEPVCIGEDAQIDAYAVVGPGAVVGKGCRIGKNARVQHSVLWDHVAVGQNAVLNGAAVPSETCIPQNSQSVPAAAEAAAAEAGAVVLKPAEPIRLAFLSTYPPRACGIATFTQDLMRELDKLPETADSRVVAVSDGRYRYGPRVKYELDQQDAAAYPRAAVKLNGSSVDLLMIEHEYGIYGGADGGDVLDLASALQIPFVVTLHTVLSAPGGNQRRILHILGERAARVVTMAHNTVPLLQQVYGIDPQKIAVIPHGVPVRKREPRELLKKRFGLAGRSVVSTFGLLSPGKGLEYGIRAAALAAQRHPEVLYLILGQTHPVVRAQSGESYRASLEELVQNLHAADNVRFVNHYLTKDEIIRYLELSDLYMTPYLGREQAVSGTLAYAVGYGRVIVSTPYPYAREMLAEGRGLLAEFGNAESLAEKICTVLENPEQKREMERRTLAYGVQMMWDSVARDYRELFRQVLREKESGRNAD